MILTTEGLIFGQLIHTSIDKARSDRLKSKNYIISKKNFNIIGTENAIFQLDENIDKIQESINKYNFDDIRPTDNVLDIGANVGEFCLSIHNKVNHVYIVEHSMKFSIMNNIQLNDAKNISIIDYNYNLSNLFNLSIFNLSIEELIKLCGNHIDFIKISNCESYACPAISDIFNIRRIEAEICNKYYLNNFENLLTSSGFDYTKKTDSKNNTIISAKNRYID